MDSFDQHRWALLVLVFLLLVPLPREAPAQTTCTGTDCPSEGACSGFETHECSLPNGCAGKWVCTISTGFQFCYTFGSQIPCAACGAEGFQACSPFGQLSACRPVNPGVEICNSCDDDANGLVDEGLSGSSCTLANGCSGELSCLNGISSCNLKSGSTRPCSECANGTMACNSNGTFGTCQPVAPTAEVCNGCDDNGDGQTDEGLGGAACTLANGCSGVSVCSGTLTCSPPPFPQPSTRACSECGAGGFQTCSSTGIEPCRPAIVTAETCNGCDDDADGVVDEVRASCGPCSYTMQSA